MSVLCLNVFHNYNAAMPILYLTTVLQRLAGKRTKGLTRMFLIVVLYKKIHNSSAQFLEIQKTFVTGIC